MCSGADLGDTALGIQGAGTIMSTAAAYTKSKADKAAYEIQANTADANAALDTAKSADAKYRGEVAVQNARFKARQLEGQQRAGLAASGVSLESGSPLAILEGTEVMGARDSQIIRDNALKEAWGYDVAAVNERNNARFLRYRAGAERPGLDAATTLLTGVGSVASSWYNIRKSGATLA